MVVVTHEGDLVLVVLVWQMDWHLVCFKRIDSARDVHDCCTEWQFVSSTTVSSDKYEAQLREITAFVNWHFFGMSLSCSSVRRALSLLQ